MPLERPALQRLLAGIGEGLIDVVVVYKVDRLTRSLADFAKMVELFEARRRNIDLLILPTDKAMETLAQKSDDTNAILHVTC
jgi:DNA invertase Pin-like site-specific DNA recombinase